jgi:hypothetical protein
MVLQGMDLPVHDIDLQTSRAGAHEIERRLSAYVVKSVHEWVSPNMRSHYGQFDIDGVKLEVMGDVQKRVESRDWEEPVRVENYRRWVVVEGMPIPVLSLEYEHQAYLKMGRLERARLIATWLRAHGKDDPSPSSPDA